MPSDYHLRTKKTWQQTIDDLGDTMAKWNIVTWSVSPSHTTRSASKANQSAVERTVVLRWRRADRVVELRMGDQERALDNLRVLYLVVEALRLNDLRGIGQTVAEAYRQQYPALPAPGQTTAAPAASDPYAVLYVRPDAPLGVAEAAYKVLARAAHPDAGGDATQMARLNAAIDAIRKEKA